MKAIWAAIILAWPVASQAACRHALALGLDVSGSVDAQEYRLQLDGLAAALESDAVQAVLFAPGAAPVRIAVYEWSGPLDQFVILPWTSLDAPAVLAEATQILRGANRHPAEVTTAIGPAMLFGFLLLDSQTDCWKRTLDISGDGEANTGLRPQQVPRSPQAADIIVNGLSVSTPQHSAELNAYFRAYVIRGPGAFVENADGFDDYGRAMERKLLRELQAIAIGADQ